MTFVLIIGLICSLFFDIAFLKIQLYQVISGSGCLLLLWFLTVLWIVRFYRKRGNLRMIEMEDVIDKLNNEIYLEKGVRWKVGNLGAWLQMDLEYFMEDSILM